LNIGPQSLVQSFGPGYVDNDVFARAPRFQRSPHVSDQRSTVIDSGLDRDVDHTRPRLLDSTNQFAIVPVGMTRDPMQETLRTLEHMNGPIL
jgi:hypothetical protein